MDTTEAVSSEILAARGEGRLLAPATERFELDLDSAYAVQRRLLDARLAAGEQQVGWKIGYTSRAMREQMGIAEANFGFLTDRMVLDDGAVLPHGVLQPRVEPEVAVVLGDAIAPGMTLAQVRSACREIRCALEVVDPVWRDYRFTLCDNTADGSSAAYAVLGASIPADRDLAAIGVSLHRDGRELERGNSAAVLGNPLKALRWLAGALVARGLGLAAGDLVLTGGITRAVPLPVGSVVDAIFSGVGQVGIHRDPV